jgi:predicted esterase
VKRFLLITVASLALTAAPFAGPVIDHSSDRGYILSMPIVKENSTKKPRILVVLPGKDVKAKLERDNWAFAADHHNFALVALEVDYNQIHQERDIDALHDRIQAVIKEVEAEQPTIAPGPAFLGGTSRGGMTAIALTLRHPGAYRAIGVACGATLSMGAEDDSSQAKGQWFFFVHGSNDTVVPFKNFTNTVDRLSHDGANVSTYVHQGAGHNLDTHDYLRVVKWMASFPATPPAAGKPG